MLNHYMKAVFGGSVMALLVTGFNIFAGLLFKWLTGNFVGQLVSIKHLFLFLIVLLLSAGYLTTKKPARNGYKVTDAGRF